MPLACAFEPTVVLVLFILPQAVGLARAGAAVPKQHNSTSSDVNVTHSATQLSKPRQVASFLSTHSDVPTQVFIPSRCICDYTRSGKERKRRKRDCTCAESHAQPLPEQLQFPNDAGTDGQPKPGEETTAQNDAPFFDDGLWLPPSQRGAHYTGPLGKDHALFEPPEEFDFEVTEVGPATDTTATRSLKVPKNGPPVVNTPRINKARYLKVPRVQANPPRVVQPFVDQGASEVTPPPDLGIHPDPGDGEIHAFRYRAGEPDPYDGEIHAYRYMGDERDPYDGEDYAYRYVGDERDPDDVETHTYGYLGDERDPDDREVHAYRYMGDARDPDDREVHTYRYMGDARDPLRNSHVHSRSISELPANEMLEDTYELPAMRPSRPRHPSQSRHYLQPAYLPSSYEAEYDDDGDDSD